MKKVLFSVFFVGLLAGCSNDEMTTNLDFERRPLIISPDPDNSDNLPIDSIGVALSDDSGVSSFVEYMGFSAIISDDATFDPGFHPKVVSDDSDVSSLVESMGTVSPVIDGIGDPGYNLKITYLRPANSREGLCVNRNQSRLFAFAPYRSSFTLATSKQMKPALYTKAGDFCYTYAGGFSYNNPEAVLTFKHLYSCITVSISKDQTYTSDVTINGLTLYNGAIMASADANFGGFSGIKISNRKLASTPEAGVNLKLNSQITAQSTLQLNSFLVIPVSASDISKETVLKFDMTDGTSKEVKLLKDLPINKGLNELLAGNDYNVYVTLSNDGFTIGQVDVKPWQPFDPNALVHYPVNPKR